MCVYVFTYMEDIHFQVEKMCVFNVMELSVGNLEPWRIAKITDACPWKRETNWDPFLGEGLALVCDMSFHCDTREEEMCR